MKKLIPLCTLVLSVATSSLFAQVENSEDTLTFQSENSTITIITKDLTTINKIDVNGALNKFSEGMSAAAAEYSAKIKDINERQANGEISEEEAEDLRDEATDTFEEKVDALADAMDEWADESSMDPDSTNEGWEEYARIWEEEATEMGDTPTTKSKHRQIIRIGEDGIVIEDIIDDDEAIIEEDDEDHYVGSMPIFGFHFGWNTMLTPNGELAGGGAEVNFFESWAYDLEFGHKVRLGETSPFTFQYGLNFSWHNLETKMPLLKYEDPNNAGEPMVAFEDDGRNISETEFDIVYMDIPLMFGIDLSGQELNEGFTLAVGGYGGVRLSSERETTYNDFNGDEVEEDLDDHFLSNQWRYGVMGQIGWGSFKITGRYDLNPLFQSRYSTPSYQMASLTLGFVF